MDRLVGERVRELMLGGYAGLTSWPNGKDEAGATQGERQMSDPIEVLDCDE